MVRALGNDIKRQQTSGKIWGNVIMAKWCTGETRCIHAGYKKKTFPGNRVRQWHRLPIETLQLPSMELFKTSPKETHAVGSLGKVRLEVGWGLFWFILWSCKLCRKLLPGRSSNATGSMIVDSHIIFIKDFRTIFFLKPLLVTSPKFLRKCSPMGWNANC